MPFVVIQGNDDRMTPTPLARQLVDDVKASRKAFAAIEGGHFACYTNGEAFAAALETQLRT